MTDTIASLPPGYIPRTVEESRNLRAAMTCKPELPPLDVIAFTGKSGAGKDSAATVLVNHRGFITIAFADLLRRQIAEAWRIDERMLTDRSTKEWAIPALAAGNCAETGFMAWCAEAGESLHTPRSARWVMQNYATWRRRFTPDLYAAHVAAWIRRQIGVGRTRIAVTDLRDPIEQAALRPFGAHAIRIHRQEVARLAEDAAGHSSERAPDRLHIDADLTNDGSLTALAESVLSCALVPQGRA